MEKIISVTADFLTKVFLVVNPIKVNNFAYLLDCSLRLNDGTILVTWAAGD